MHDIQYDLFSLLALICLLMWNEIPQLHELRKYIFCVYLSKYIYINLSRNHTTITIQGQPAIYDITRFVVYRYNGRAISGVISRDVHFVVKSRGGSSIQKGGFKDSPALFPRKSFVKNLLISLCKKKEGRE